MIQDAIRKVVAGESLTREEAALAMTEIMEGKCAEAQIAALLVALRMKGETAEEIAGFASVMREKALHVAAPEDCIDTCGTGGDSSGTFNISTAAAIAAAGAGAVVAKHGNRSVSSASGSADVLKALGVKIDCAPALVERSIAEAGIGFLFAPAYHPSMKHAMPVRKALAMRTVFNVLGPLTNPAGARRQVLGVYDRKLLSLLAEALRELGSVHVLVVASEDGLDEISVSAKTFVAELKDGAIREFAVDPAELGLAPAPREALAAASAEKSAAAIRTVLAGEKGPKRDAALLNAAAALEVAGLAGDLAAGIAKAAGSVDSGAAAGALEKLVAITNG